MNSSGLFNLVQVHIERQSKSETLHITLYLTCLVAALMSPAPRLPHLLPDWLNHLILELDDLHIGHHGPVLPVENIQRLCDVPQPRDCLQPLVLKVRELSPGGHHTVHRDLRGASEHWHLQHRESINFQEVKWIRDWRSLMGGTVYFAYFMRVVRCLEMSKLYVWNNSVQRLCKTAWTILFAALTPTIAALNKNQCLQFQRIWI